MTIEPLRTFSSIIGNNVNLFRQQTTAYTFLAREEQTNRIEPLSKRQPPLKHRSMSHYAPTTTVLELVHPFAPILSMFVVMLGDRAAMRTGWFSIPAHILPIYPAILFGMQHIHHLK